MISVIIPDRGDRPEFTEHALYQLQRNIDFSQIDVDVCHVNYTPQGNTPDLTGRIREGLKMAKYDYVTIWENDDYYPDNYLNQVNYYRLNGISAIGSDITTYYHILQKSYKNMPHHGRSSLCCTSFDKKILDDFVWPADDYVFLDIEIWKHIFSKMSIFMDWFGVIGIKHGMGLCGGMGHRNGHRFENKDYKYKWLKENVRKESYEFYIDIASQLTKERQAQRV